MRVAVIGSGVVGLTIAFRLAQQGIQVSVFEQGKLAAKSSWAGAGILPPSNDRDPVHAIDHLQSLSNHLHPELANELLELTGIDNEYQQCGGIYLGRTIGESASLTGTTGLWQQQGISFQKLDVDDLGELEPSFRRIGLEKVKSAILVPSESQLRNPRHLKALLAACTKLNVEFYPETRVEKIDSEARTVRLGIAGNSFESDFVCISTGAWTTSLVSSFSRVQVVPIKGHMLLYRLEKPPFQRIINEANRYIVCRMDGHVLVGSSEEETGLDESISQEEVERLKEFATSLIPNLCESQLKQTWTGLRPMAYDHLPYIGPHSNYPNVIFATGHFRSGLHLSPATAQVVCNMVLGRQNDFDVSALRPER